MASRTSHFQHVRISPLYANDPKMLIQMMGFADRSVEYRADRFAGVLGFGPGLVGFLGRLAGMEANSEHRFLVMHLQSHPPTALRIDRLEQMQEVQAAA